MGVNSTDPENVPTECQSCKKKGHLARMCQSRLRTGHKNSGQTKATTNPSKKGGDTTKRDANWVNAMEEDQAETEPFPDSVIFNIGSHRDTPITVQLETNEQEVLMEVDTGAAVILMSEEMGQACLGVIG